MSNPIYDLDAPTNEGAILVLRIAGQPVALSKTRLVELIERESAYLALVTGGADARPAAAPDPVKKPSTRKSFSGETVTHGQLSTRVKRIYEYALTMKELRRAHREHLTTLLQHFDWELPAFPNSQLDFHLREIVTWKGIDKPMRQLIEDFLARYTELRYRKRG